MGSTYLAGILDSGLSMKVMLHWHLTSNCYPPIDTDLHESIWRAITEVAEMQYLTEIPLLDDATMPAINIVKELHLDSFVDALRKSNSGDQW